MNREELLSIKDLKSMLEKYAFRKDGCPNQTSFRLKWWFDKGLLNVFYSIEYYKKEYNITNNMQFVYHIMNDIVEIPLCEVCNENSKSWYSYTKGYKQVCSVKCSASHPLVQTKRNQTNLEKYGHECVFGSSMIREKIYETNTNKYGVKHPAQNIVVLGKIQQTNLERYGVASTLQVPEVKEKINVTIRKKYNKDHYSQKNISNEVLEKLNDPEWLFDQHVGQKKILSQIGKELSVSECTVGNYLRKYNIETCVYGGSYVQKEVENFVSQYTDIVTNSRKLIPPKEIDIYLPKYNLAIEFNGLYWHTDLFVDKFYHINKLLECKNKNIKLIQIFEDEWKYKQKIVKSILLSKLGIFDRRIFANKCNVIEANNKNVREFVDNNHIQGNCGASKYYCLYFGDELVSVASIGKSRFKKDEYELIRYCSKINLQIVGGFSKLLKRIKKDFPVLYSYTDLRYFNGDIYKSYGTHIKRTKPGYYWTDGVKRISRYKTQKPNIINILGDKYDETLTEEMNMKNNGFYKIYDCGNDLFLL